MSEFFDMDAEPPVKYLEAANAALQKKIKELERKLRATNAKLERTRKP